MRTIAIGLRDTLVEVEFLERDCRGPREATRCDN